MANVPPINATLNDIFKTTAVGDVTSAIGNALYGINHRQTPGALPVNRDQHGLTFFTRPQFNLTDDNASVERKFVPLLTTEDLSIQRMVRKLLDPRCELDCPVVDQKLAFIPVLTNLLLTCSGWPDPTLDVHTSKPGVYKEEFSMVDSVIDKYSNFNLSLSFRNVQGDPIMSLFDVWQTYMSHLFVGKMMPYPDFIAANEVDYETRIYRLVLDRNRRLVQKIAIANACYPLSNPYGKAFDYDHSRPRNDGFDEIQINFRCNGYEYNDPILVQEFNHVVGYFNEDMREDRRDALMIQVPAGALQIFNNRGYPYIDPDTMELQWWVSRNQYDATMAGFSRTVSAIGGNDATFQPD